VSTSVFHCHYHSISAPYAFLATRCFYQKSKRMKMGNLTNSNGLSETGDHSTENKLHLAFKGLIYTNMGDGN